LKEAVQRIVTTFFHQENGAGDKNNILSWNDAYEQCIRHSFVVSSDQAHAVHPNYASKHEKNHQPVMNGGMVIKRNSNQRYATNPVTGLIMREIAKRAKLSPIQEFMVRQDCGCGSTIGPAISTNTGIRTIDMGCPQLSMHSIRETMGTADLTNGLELFTAYFQHFREVDQSIEQ
jgi:aspartyl aminopeptidase